MVYCHTDTTVVFTAETWGDDSDTPHHENSIIARITMMAMISAMITIISMEEILW
jgi:hypothetical protein